MQEAIQYLNVINLYENTLRRNNTIESKTRGELVFEAMGLDVKKVNSLIAELVSLSLKASKAARKDRDVLEQLKAEQNQKRLEVKRMFLSTRLIKNVKEMEEPDFIDKLIERDEVSVAYNQHYYLFKERMKVLRDNPQIANAYDRELRKINLDLKLIKYLFKALQTKNQELYKKVNKTIQERFNRLPRAITARNTDLRFVVAGCLRRDVYFTDTHPFFDKIRADIRHPTIYISIAILSKTCVELERQY